MWQVALSNCSSAFNVTVSQLFPIFITAYANFAYSNFFVHFLQLAELKREICFHFISFGCCFNFCCVFYLLTAWFLFLHSLFFLFSLACVGIDSCINISRKSNFIIPSQAFPSERKLTSGKATRNYLRIRGSSESAVVSLQRRWEWVSHWSGFLVRLMA